MFYLHSTLFTCIIKYEQYRERCNVSQSKGSKNKNKNPLQTKTKHYWWFLLLNHSLGIQKSDLVLTVYN